MGSIPKELLQYQSLVQWESLKMICANALAGSNPACNIFLMIYDSNPTVLILLLGRLTALSGMRAFFLRIALSGAGVFQTASFDITANFDITASYFPRFSPPLFW